MTPSPQSKTANSLSQVMTYCIFPFFPLINTQFCDTVVRYPQTWLLETSMRDTSTESYCPQTKHMYPGYQEKWTGKSLLISSLSSRLMLLHICGQHSSLPSNRLVATQFNIVSFQHFRLVWYFKKSTLIPKELWERKQS